MRIPDLGLRAWRERASEATWKLSPSLETPYPPSWPLDRERLSRAVVRWPSSYEWPPSAKWVDPLREGLRKHVTVESAPIAQTEQGVVALELVLDGHAHVVTVDYHDLPALNARSVERSAVYFKMQHARGGYDAPQVVPGGFVPANSGLYRFAVGARALRDRRGFAYDVYGRFGLEFARDVRRRAVEMLRAQQRFRFEGSLHTVRYSHYLREVALSKVCIDLPGNGDFCFRLVDYFGVGACVVGPRHGTRLHVDLVDREHIVYAADDLSDLVDLCERYLRDDEERERLCRNAREFFDRYLHRDQLAAYYLSTCLGRIPAA